MKPKNLLVLLLILGLPPLVYVIYVTFAQNHYVSLPFFGEKKIIQVDTEEGPQIDTIYYSLDKLGEQISTESSDEIDAFVDGHFTVVSLFSSSDKELNKRLFSQLIRVQNSFEDNDLVRIISLVKDDHLDWFQAQKGRKDNWKYFAAAANEISVLNDVLLFPAFCKKGELSDCGALLILDHQKRIRGYYKGLQKRDVDDLMGALRVLRIEFYNENPVF